MHPTIPTDHPQKSKVQSLDPDILSLGKFLVLFQGAWSQSDSHPPTSRDRGLRKSIKKIAVIPTEASTLHRKQLSWIRAHGSYGYHGCHMKPSFCRQSTLVSGIGDCGWLRTDEIPEYAPRQTLTASLYAPLYFGSQSACRGYFLECAGEYLISPRFSFFFSRLDTDFSLLSLAPSDSDSV